MRIDHIWNLASQFEKVANALNKRANSTVIRFRPGEVDGVVATTIQLYGGKYTYDSKGSTVVFSPKQLHDFLSVMKDATQSEYFDEEEKAKHQETINHVISQLPEA